MNVPSLEPMLATPWPAPFDDDEWWFEVKWDGIRAMVAKRDRVEIRSRRGRAIAGAYPELAGLDLPAGVVLDGEIVAFDSTGAPSFQVLQRRMNLSSRAAAEAAATIPVSLVAFDLLWEAGESLVTLPLEERRRRLTALRLERVVIPDPVPREGTALFRAVVERGLEGMVAKRLGSTYQPGRRSPDWRKVVHRRSARFVVGGYLPGEGGRSASFGSLVLGLWDGETLRFVGSVGSGFDDRSLRLVRHAIDQIGRSTSPFRAGDVVPPAARWVEPALVAVVEFRQWTGDNHLRAPVFKGFTTDPVGEVTWEAEGP